jgi:hypothetical protein
MERKPRPLGELLKERYSDASESSPEAIMRGGEPMMMTKYFGCGDKQKKKNPKSVAHGMSVSQLRQFILTKSPPEMDLAHVISSKRITSRQGYCKLLSRFKAGLDILTTTGLYTGPALSESEVSDNSSSSDSSAEKIRKLTRRDWKGKIATLNKSLALMKEQSKYNAKNKTLGVKGRTVRRFLPSGITMRPAEPLKRVSPKKNFASVPMDYRHMVRKEHKDQLEKRKLENKRDEKRVRKELKKEYDADRKKLKKILSQTDSPKKEAMLRQRLAHMKLKGVKERKFKTRLGEYRTLKQRKRDEQVAKMASRANREFLNGLAASSSGGSSSSSNRSVAGYGSSSNTKPAKVKGGNLRKRPENMDPQLGIRNLRDTRKHLLEKRKVSEKGYKMPHNFRVAHSVDWFIGEERAKQRPLKRTKYASSNSNQMNRLPGKARTARAHTSQRQFMVKEHWTKNQWKRYRARVAELKKKHDQEVTTLVASQKKMRELFGGESDADDDDASRKKIKELSKKLEENLKKAKEGIKSPQRPKKRARKKGDYEANIEGERADRTSKVRTMIYKLRSRDRAQKYRGFSVNKNFYDTKKPAQKKPLVAGRKGYEANIDNKAKNKAAKPRKMTKKSRSLDRAQKYRGFIANKNFYGSSSSPEVSKNRKMTNRAQAFVLFDTLRKMTRDQLRDTKKVQKVLMNKTGVQVPLEVIEDAITKKNMPLMATRDAKLKAMRGKSRGKAKNLVETTRRPTEYRASNSNNSGGDGESNENNREPETEKEAAAAFRRLVSATPHPPRFRRTPAPKSRSPSPTRKEQERIVNEMTRKRKANEKISAMIKNTKRQLSQKKENNAAAQKRAIANQNRAIAAQNHAIANMFHYEQLGKKSSRLLNRLSNQAKKKGSKAFKRAVANKKGSNKLFKRAVPNVKRPLVWYGNL